MLSIVVEGEPMRTRYVETVRFAVFPLDDRTMPQEFESYSEASEYQEYLKALGVDSVIEEA